MVASWYCSFGTLIHILKFWACDMVDLTVVNPLIFHPKCPWFAAKEPKIRKHGIAFHIFLIWFYLIVFPDQSVMHISR